MTKLSDDKLHELHKAAVDAGLASNRTTLLGGLDAGIRTTLPDESNPSAQLLSDLQTLNAIEPVDGSIPLLSWIKNADRLAVGLKQGQAFKDTIEELSGVADAAETSPSPNPSQHVINQFQTVKINGIGFFELFDLLSKEALQPPPHLQGSDEGEDKNVNLVSLLLSYFPILSRGIKPGNLNHFLAYRLMPRLMKHGLAEIDRTNPGRIQVNENCYIFMDTLTSFIEQLHDASNKQADP